ncbi:MAG: hypothetical protein ABGY15_06615 [bacterium]
MNRTTEENIERTVAAELLVRWISGCSATLEDTPAAAAGWVSGVDATGALLRWIGS